MPNFRFSLVPSGGIPQNIDSKDIEVDFASVRLGADNLRLSQSGAGLTAAFSTNGRRLKTAAPTDSDDVARLETVQTLITTFQNDAYWQTPVSSELSTPPVSPATNQRHLVGASPTGAFAGQATKIAQWSGTAWVFKTPLSGFAIYALDKPRAVRLFVSSVWLNLSFSGQWLEKEFPAVSVSGQTSFPLNPEIILTAGAVVEVFRNGQRMRQGAANDYTINVGTNTVTFSYTVPEASIIQVRVYPE